MKCFLVSMLCVFCLLFFVAPTSSKMITMSLKELTDQADLIILGLVTNIRCQKEERSTWTYVTLQVEQTLNKDTVSSQIIIKVEGGLLCNLLVEDQPEFRNKERVVVFLKRESAQDDFFILCGAKQGKFTVVDNQVKQKPLNVFLLEIKEYLSEKKK